MNKQIYVNGQRLRTPREKTRDHKVTLNIFTVIYFIYAATLLFPFLWLIYNSLKDKFEFGLNPWMAPKAPLKMLSNYTKIFSEFNLGAMFFNSVILATAMPFINLFFCLCTAYAYAMHDFKGKKALYAVAMIPMVVNIVGTLPAQYSLYAKLHVIDNIPMLLLTCTGGVGFAFMLFAGVLENVSRSYKEAAEIDGAGPWRIFLQIYAPQIATVFGAQWLLGFIGNWNEYMMFYLYLPSHQTLSVGINKISEQVMLGFSQFSGDYPKLFAAMLLSVVPVVLLFYLFQNKIMRFSMGGGLKG